jgi:hypothetical protein
MLNERAVYLINAEIDGALEPGEQEELESILDSSEEARAMRVELRKLASLLDDTPQQEPPADLVRRIVEQLPAPRRRSGFSLSGLFSSLQPAPMAAAFAAGLLAAVGFYELSSQGRPTADVTNMVGTMVAPGLGVEAVKRDRLELSAPGVSGTMSLDVQGDVFVVDVDLSSSQTIEIHLDLDESGLVFGGLARAESVSAGEESYEVSGGALRVIGQGQQAFSVFLRQTANWNGRDREIGLVVSSAGQPVVTGVLRG